MSTDEYNREPCPWRIIEDVGGAFSMGLIGGGIFQSLKGFRNAPSGMGRRFSGAFSTMRTHAPKYGGQFAVWGGTFSSVDCALVAIRKKQDPWNSIISGAVTGGVLSARAGLGPMTASAILGGTLLGIVEGISILVNNFGPMMQAEEPTEPMPDPANLGSASKPQSAFM